MTPKKTSSQKATTKNTLKSAVKNTRPTKATEPKKATVKKPSTKGTPIAVTRAKKTDPAKSSKKTPPAKTTKTLGPTKATTLKRLAKTDKASTTVRTPRPVTSVPLPATKLPLRASVSPTTIAMLDLLSDGEKHSPDEVLRVGLAAALADDYNRCILEGKRARRNRPADIVEYAHSGARSFARNNLMIAKRNGRILSIGKGDKEMLRMPKALAVEWASARAQDNIPHRREEVAVQPFGQITSYAGMTEWEGWAYSPLKTQDVAHVRPTLNIPLAELREAFPGWEVNESPDGLITVAAHSGAPVKEVVTAWFTEKGYHHDGVRDAKGVRRRNLNHLPVAFLSDLMAKSVPFARGLVASRYGASMQRLVGDHDDIEGYIILWIVELVQSFDASLGRPFGTWLTNQIPRKVQDLNRASHGRTASDAEIRHARARAAFEAEHGRTPTMEEMAKLLGLSAEEMRVKRRHLNTLASLRTATPLETGPDEPEIVIVDEEMTPEELAMHRERSQQITLSLLAASGQFDPTVGLPRMTRPLGFLVTYLMMWDDWVKGDLIALAGCADRKVTDEVEQVHRELARLLADMREAD